MGRKITMRRKTPSGVIEEIEISGEERTTMRIGSRELIVERPITDFKNWNSMLEELKETRREIEEFIRPPEFKLIEDLELPPIRWEDKATKKGQGRQKKEKKELFKRLKLAK